MSKEQDNRAASPTVSDDEHDSTVKMPIGCVSMENQCGKGTNHQLLIFDRDRIMCTRVNRRTQHGART